MYKVLIHIDRFEVYQKFRKAALARYCRRTALMDRHLSAWLIVSF